jgi:hypothetical protein
LIVRNDSVSIGIQVQGHFFQSVDHLLVCGENPPQKTDEEQKEDHKGYHWPDGDVIDALKHILVHDSGISVYLVAVFSPLMSFPSR